MWNLQSILASSLTCDKSKSITRKEPQLMHCSKLRKTEIQHAPWSVRGVHKLLSVMQRFRRDYAVHHGINIKRSNIRVMVPVSLRQENERGMLGNKVSLLPVDIPLDTDNPLDRLNAVTDRTNLLKRAKVADLHKTPIAALPDPFRTISEHSTNPIPTNGRNL